jgi:glycosyltransferase involved in cell wall biosynthesis
MKFTIFTGFYNYKDTIDQLASSVMSQTYQDWEWIIWDDFSDDPEISILLDKLRSADARIKRVYPNFKKEFFWNPPVDKATGEICMVLDSDDMMLPALLSTYAHNFRKFPDVQMISCNSEMRNDSVLGDIRSMRYINYQNNCNLLESMDDSSYEYNWGDCRAWRNRVSKFTEGEWNYCGDDLIKVLVSEKIGKTLFLPRTLHVYAHREGSVSHTPEHGRAIEEENEKIIKTIGLHNREICSIEDFYDRRFSDLTPLYLSSINWMISGTAINYVSSTTDARGREILKELYPEHMIDFNAEKIYPHAVFKIALVSDIEILRGYIERNILPSETLTIEAAKEFKDEVLKVLSKVGKPFSWFLYNKFNCNIEMK